MIYRKLDPNGDYIFGSNGNCYLSGAEAVQQAIVTRCACYFTNGGKIWKMVCPCGSAS